MSIIVSTKACHYTGHTRASKDTSLSMTTKMPLSLYRIQIYKPIGSSPKTFLNRPVCLLQTLHTHTHIYIYIIGSLKMPHYTYLYFSLYNMSVCIVCL